MEDKRDTLIKNIEDTKVTEDTAAEEERAGDVAVPETAEDQPAVDTVAPEDGPEAEPSESEPAETVEDAPEEPAEESEAEGGEGEETKEFGLPEGHHEMGELRERIENRKNEKKKKQRHFRTWVYVTACALMLIVFGLFFSLSGFFTVDSIEVEGNKHYTSEEIINIAHAVPGRNLIYNTNKSEMIAYLEQNPYIKSAEIRRKLPSTILIVVNERSERMAFKYDDDYLVMDGEGILLKKTRNLPQTTLVEGLIVNKIKLGEKIGTEDREKTNKTITLIDRTASADLYFIKINVSDLKKVRAYIYDNLVVKADYNTLMTNIENGHLHRVVESLFKDGIKRGTITFDEDGSASFMPVI